MMFILNFKTFFLYFESEKKETRYYLPNLKDFNSLDKQYSFKKNQMYYRINTEKTESYIWIHIEYGSTMPRSDKIINILDDSEKDNKRNKDEVELTHQVFFLYFFQSNTLYLSDSRKQSMITDFFKEKLNISIFFKPYIKNLDEFVSMLDSINEISFTCEKDLFYGDNQTLTAFEDFTGYSAPDKLKIITSYKRRDIKNIFTFLKKLNDEKERGHLNRLIMKGFTEDNVQLIYNLDAITENISIKIIKNEEGKYSPNFVKSELLKKIYSYYEKD